MVGDVFDSDTNAWTRSYLRRNGPIILNGLNHVVAAGRCLYLLACRIKVLEPKETVKKSTAGKRWLALAWRWKGGSDFG